MSNFTNVLSSSYDEKFFTTQVNLYKDMLEQTGVFVLPQFLSAQATRNLQKEAADLKPKAFQSSAEYNVYVLPQDPDFESDSPRNRLFQTTKLCVPDDLIPADSCLRGIYDSLLFRSFMAQVVGVDQLYPYSDPLSSININYYGPGDALDWHFDNSDFTITLLGKKCVQGGDFEYCTDMRYDAKGDENYDLVEDILDGKVAPERESMNAGDLMVFKGNKSLHRVAPVLEGERILITFNFNSKPGVALSEKSRQTFFGRTQ
ncbi:MAG TPA: 2OG-Fe(II) oxygenase [Candidatus Gracilibacteria bacterium]